MRVAFAVLALSMLCACGAPPPLTHSAYVWQRDWRPSLLAALRDSSKPFGEWRVLGIEVVGARVTHIDTDAAALIDSGKPVRMVARIEGARLAVGADTMARQLNMLATRLRSERVVVSGIEIDHDCATVALPDYADWLAELRRAMPGESISITVLPTWLDSAELTPLLGNVDHSVLQVHAIAHPRDGLFDVDRALPWIERISQLGTRFYIALPAYHVAVSVDASGAVIAVAAEDLDPGAATEIRSDPQEVARLLRTLERGPPPGLLGIVWFRLPLVDDHRAWHPRTLAAVIAGEALSGSLHIESATNHGVTSFALRASGNLDQMIGSVDLPRNCRFADALGAFALEGHPGKWRLLPRSQQWLKPDQRTEIGWCRG